MDSKIAVSQSVTDYENKSFTFHKFLPRFKNL